MTDQEIKDAIHLQCLAKFAPKRVTIPGGWRPKNAYERNLVLLLAQHDPEFVKLGKAVRKVVAWGG